MANFAGTCDNKGLLLYFSFSFFNKSAKMSIILCFSVNMGCCVYINEEKMNLNDFCKWLQYNKE